MNQSEHKKQPTAAELKKQYQSSDKYSKEERWENVAAFGVFIVLILVIVGFSTSWFGLSKKSVLKEQFPVTKISLTAEASLGAKDARILVVELSDFECPFCGQFHSEVFPRIKEEYIDTGRVLWFFMEQPLTKIHPHSYEAAIAAECAKLQGKFWEYHDILFSNQKALEVSDLKKYASDLSLDTVSFNRCLDANETQHIIVEGRKQAYNAGISSTPSFIVGQASYGDSITGFKVVGAESFETFQKLIEAVKHKELD